MEMLGIPPRITPEIWKEDAEEKIERVK